jgi:hypothetical protein
MLKYLYQDPLNASNATVAGVGRLHNSCSSSLWNTFLATIENQVLARHPRRGRSIAGL